MVPPVIVGSLWLALSLLGNGNSPGNVEVRDRNSIVGVATQDEALDYVAGTAGMVPVLPTELPRGGYKLVRVDAVAEATPAVGYRGVHFVYETADAEPSRFWVSQSAAGALDVPKELLPIVTRIEGARIWTIGEPPEDARVGDEFQFIFLARSATYDRVVVFEGAKRPNTERAVEVIESILRQD